MAVIPFNSTGKFSTQTSGIATSTTTFGQTDLLRIPEVDPHFHELNTGSALFYRLLSMVGKEEASDQARYEFFEDDKYPTITSINFGAGYSDSATSIVITDAIATVNSVLWDERTEEAMFVSAVSSTTCTVVRGHQGTTAAAIIDGDTIVVLGASLPEGADANGGIAILPTKDYNFCSFFSQGVNATDIQESTLMLNGTGQLSREFTKQTLNIMEQMDNALRWHTRNADTSTSSAGTLYYTNGFNAWCATNQETLTGSLTWKDFNTTFNGLFEPTNSSPSKTLLCGQGLYSAINDVCWGRWTNNPAFEATLGATMGTIALDGGGILNVVLDKYGFQTGTPLTNRGFVIDIANVSVKPSSAFDLTWREITAPESHTKKFEVYSSTSLKVVNEETCATVTYTA